MILNNMRKCLLIPFFLCGAIMLGACKNYLGNPHRKAAPDRKVPALRDAMRVEPPFWWTGMKNPRVEVLVHSENIAAMAMNQGEMPKGIKLESVAKVENPNYLFLTFLVAPDAEPGKARLTFALGNQVETLEYGFYERSNTPKAQGLDASDAVYLVFPDRFSNGDPSNDTVNGMLQGLERDSLVGRHGGDLKGVMKHLNYISDLGITALWLNPELENDQPKESYHGYAITDHYRIDRRMGTNEQYRELVRQCHDKKMKVVRDVVVNHIGSNHYWMRDLPEKSWLNQWDTFTRTTYRAPTLVDPYASELDRKLFSNGWFDYHMPDLNQQNGHVSKYLIQQALWWIEYAGIDALRIDTYTYSDQAFMSDFCKQVREQYPTIGMVGEIWEHSVPIQGFFADNQPMMRAHFDSNLPGVIDFQVMFAIQEALTREQGWTEGAARVYYTLAQDYFYEDPFKNLIMLDNHDFTRFFTTVNENLNKYKSGIAFLLTSRGIPQIYYATEILGTGNSWPSHGNIRKDFPGGWYGDKVDKFTEAGRNPEENDAFNFTRTLLQYRKNNPVLHRGKMTQFVPVDGIYTYVRYDDTHNPVLVILNTSNKTQTVRTARFAERTAGFSKAKNIVTGELINNFSVLEIPANSPLVLELNK